ncbi:MAG: chemotaxis protein CheA [Methylococcaceae bacterium]
MIDLSLLEDFISGAGESLDEMETALLELEINPNHDELFHTIFRAIHTIKGAAQFVGLDKVSALSHVLEDLLDLLRENKKQVSPEIIELLIQTKDRISTLVADLAKTQSEITEVDDLIEKIKSHLEETAPVIHDSTPQDNEEELDLAAFLNANESKEEELDLASFLNTHESKEEELDLASFLNASESKEEELDLASFLNASESKEEELDLATFLANDLHNDNATLEDFLKEDSQLVEPVIENEATATDDFIEEHDQELFAIYLQQLAEKTDALHELSQQLVSSEDKASLLNTAIELVENLKFSANYMGYEKLVRIYNEWLNEISDAQESLALNSAVSWAFMSAYLQQLQQQFPQLAHKDFNTAPLANVEITTVSDNTDENNNADLAFITELLPENNTINTQETVVIDNAPKEQVIDVLEDEEHLFTKLSHAFDNSIARSITAEPINEMFSALLNLNNEQKSKDTLPPLRIKTLEEANQEPEPISPLVLQANTEKPVIEITRNEIEETQSSNTEKTPVVNTADKALKRSIRVDADKIDSLMNQVGELIVDRAYFFQLANEINELQRYLKEIGLAQKDLKPVRTFAYRFSEAIISLGRTSNELQEGVMKIRMLPIAQLFNRYPRLVHDLAHTNNKKVQLEIRGEETELDKMIIEEISDPLIHMIRNAIGHGIESAEIRKQKGKPEIGTLILEAYHESNHIVIEVTDDGRGVDIDNIKLKAQEMALFSSEELNRMSADDLTRFIMLPGFSTAKEISSTSGRGVGMDVVKKNIEKLNGTIEVESKLGVETKIRLKIPLTLAIIQALLVRVGEDSFTIPLANVEETLRVNAHEISLLEDTEVMYLRGKTLPIFRLSVLFNVASSQEDKQGNFFVVVVNTGNQKIGLMVDALLGQEEVVIKPLVDYLHEQNCFSGATIIGDGRISLILDVYELVNMATNKQIKRHQEQEKKSLASLENHD